MRFRILYFTCFLAFISQPTYAIKVAGLYQAVVSVSDESAQKRNIALKQALGKVLVKITGDRNINNSMGVTSLLATPGKFVQQYRYRQNSNNWDQDKSAYKLWVQFDESALDATLKTYGIPIWEKERPSILVWLVHNKDKNRSFVGIERGSEYLNILENRASARGVRLLFPLLDLQDNSKISVTDVWGGFTEPILNASKRYQANVVLTSKFTQVLPTLWESDWSVYFDNQVVNWTSQSDIADIVLEEGIDELVDKLVSRYTQTEGQNTEVIQLLVNDINSVDEYAKTFSYLTSIQSVDTVNVKQTTPNYILFELTSNRSAEGVYQAISLGKILESVEGGDVSEYRLLP